MKHLLTITSALLLSTSLSFAAGSHSGGHDDTKKSQGHSDDHGSDDHHDEMAAGKPGEASAVTRTISVKMYETEDGEMLFKPKAISVKQNQTIRFAITNKGENEHEFVLDSFEKNQEHKAAMAKFPEMEHDDPNSVRLEEGEKGEIIWTFTNNGEFEFACLIPGHYESGMKGNLSVASH